MKLIDLDEAIDAIESTNWYHINDCGEPSEGADGDESALYKATDIYKAIGEVPVMDAEPVRHGRWIDIDSQMYTWKVRCDQCGHERSMMSTQGRYPKYCENCGAKMGEKE